MTPLERAARAMADNLESHDRRCAGGGVMDQIDEELWDLAKFRKDIYQRLVVEYDALSGIWQRWRWRNKKGLHPETVRNVAAASLRSHALFIGRHPEYRRDLAWNFQSQGLIDEALSVRA